MVHRAISGILLILCAALPAYGADLELSVSGAAEYDDNVFRRENDRESDVLFRVRPGVRVFEDRGDDLNFSVGYEVPFEFALDYNEELRDEDHLVDGTFTYHVSDRLEIFGRDNFGYLRSSLRRERVADDGVDAGGGPGRSPDLSNQRDRVTENDARLGITYKFDPRLVGRLVATSDFFDPTRSDRSRFYSVGATGDVQYSLTARHQVGGGVGYSYQEFDDRDNFAGSQTDTYRIFGSWRWMVDETLILDVRAGPSYLTSQQNSSPATRVRGTVPFAVLPARSGVGFFDKNGTRITGNVGAGSLLVPSYLAAGATGTALNCDSVNGVSVLFGCSGNIILDSNNATDRQIIAAIQGSTVPLVNANPGGDSESDLTIYAEATITKRWTPTLSSALAYSRQEGNASGLGGTVIVDAVSLSNTWDFWERWQLAVRGDWTFRESAFDSEQTFDQVYPVSANTLNPAIPAGTGVAFSGLCNPANGCTSGNSFNAASRSDIDTQRWGVAARITHRLFRTTSVYVQVRYDEQESKSRSLGSTSDFYNVLATFGVRHVFDPIKLW